MSTYTYISNFGSKDSLPEGDAGKIIKGVDFETEFNNIETAINDVDSTANANASAITVLQGNVSSNDVDITALQDDKAPKASPTFTGTATFSNTNVVDGGVLSFGADDDLKIFHNASNSHIYDTGTGNLFLGSNGAGIGLQTIDVNGNSNGTLANFTNGGSCSLYYNNTKKLETTATGAKVTGTTQTTTVTFDSTAKIFSDTGAPEGVQTAPVGSVYLRTGGGEGTTLYVKESGTGNTGWVAVAQSEADLTSINNTLANHETRISDLELQVYGGA